MSALSSKFKGSASGEQLVDAGALDADGTGPDVSTSNSTQIQVKPDLMQTVAQIATPGQDAANQPQMDPKQAQAQRQLDDLMSRQQNMGAAKSAGDAGGGARMKSASDAAAQFTAKAATLAATASGADQKPSAAPSFARAAAGVAVGMGATLAAGAASPAAGAVMATATTAYDVAAAFSGRSTGPSSFKTTDSKGRETSGYVSAAPSTPEQAGGAAPISAAFMKKLTSVPGDVDAGRVDLTSAGLAGVEKAPKLDMKQLEKSVAWQGLAGVNRNGLEVARAGGENPKVEDESLEAKMPKAPIPGVFAPPKPLPLVG